MEVNVVIQQLIEEAQERADQSKAQAEKDQAQVDTLNGLVKQIDEDKETEKKAEYDRGFAEGKASIVLPEPGDDKIYSQTEVNDIVNKVEAKKDQDAQAAMDAKQKEFDGQIADFKTQLEEADSVKAERDQLLQDKTDDAEAMKAMKADIEARIDEATEVVAK